MQPGNFQSTPTSRGSLARTVGLLGSMAKVHVCNVVVLDNPSHFKNPFQFEITFECIEVS